MADPNADKKDDIEWLLQQARYMEEDKIRFYASLNEDDRELLLEAMADAEDRLWGAAPAATDEVSGSRANADPQRSRGTSRYSARRASSSRTDWAVVSLGALDDLKSGGSEWTMPCEINGHQYVITVGKSREIVLHGNYFDPSWKSLSLGDKDFALCDDGLSGARRCKSLGVGGFEKALRGGVKPEFVK